MKNSRLFHWLLIPLLLLIVGVYAGMRIGTEPSVGLNNPVFAAAAPSDNLDAVRAFSEAIIEVSENVNPTVVTIFSEKTVRASSPGFQDSPLRDFFGDDFARRFFGPPNQGRDFKQRGLGSGVIVSSDGYILTNNHVVSEADKILVGLSDGEEFEGKIIGTDGATDVAVIKIDTDGLKVASLGDSDALRVGEWVVAVGNPFGLEHSVTAGIISYKGRSNVRLADYEDFIQTDAAINPGNSGGPLVNLDGEVIGINTAIASNTGAYQGVGFAIPVNLARGVMEELIDKGKVVRGWLGVYIQDISDAVAEAMDLSTTEGVLVAGLVEDGPSDAAGLKRGDVILEMDGRKMKNGTELRNIIAGTKPGTKVKLEVSRNKDRKHFTVTLGELPTDDQEALTRRSDIIEDLGLRLHDYNADLVKRFNISGESGVIVIDVLAGSPGAEMGLRMGDLIVEANQHAVDSLEQLRALLLALDPGDSVLLLVERGRGTLFVAMKIPE